MLKSIILLLTDEMVKEINNHFKKDIEKAEKHKKKIAEFNKKRKVEKEPAKTEVKEATPEKRSPCLKPKQLKKYL